MQIEMIACSACTKTWEPEQLAPKDGSDNGLCPNCQEEKFILFPSKSAMTARVNDNALCAVHTPEGVHAGTLKEMHAVLMRYFEARWETEGRASLTFLETGEQRYFRMPGQMFDAIAGRVDEFRGHLIFTTGYDDDMAFQRIESDDEWLPTGTWREPQLSWT